MISVIYYPSNSQSKMVAGARIARWLFDNIPRKKGNTYLLTDGKTLENEAHAKKLIGDEFVVYIVNVPKTMVSNVPVMEWLVRNAKTVVWVQNDYSIWAPTEETAGGSMVTSAFTFRNRNKRPTYCWSTCGHRVDKHPSTYRYINWNALAYQLTTITPLRRNKDVVLYYGSFREGRVKEFDKYFQSGEWVIGMPKSAQAKFLERYLYDSSSMLGVIKIPEDLTLYSSTLNIEDDLSHRQFHSPANRFYEALSAELVLWVDSKAAGTLEKAGYDIPVKCVVSCADEIFERLKHPGCLPALKAAQRKWHLDPATGKDHQTALKLRLKELLKEIG